MVLLTRKLSTKLSTNFSKSFQKVFKKFSQKLTSGPKGSFYSIFCEKIVFELQG